MGLVLKNWKFRNASTPDEKRVFFTVWLMEH